MPAADKLSERLPKKHRTEDELRELKRIDIRTIAVDHFGMDTKVASKTSTADAVAFILEAQEKELGKGKGKAAPAAKAKSTPKAKPEPEPEPEAEEEQVEEVETGDSEGKIDALGQALDSMNEEVKAILDGITNTLRDIQKDQFMVYGLVANLFVISEGEGALEERIKELEEEWEKQQSGNA